VEHTELSQSETVTTLVNTSFITPTCYCQYVVRGQWVGYTGSNRIGTGRLTKIYWIGPIRFFVDRTFSNVCTSQITLYSHKYNVTDWDSSYQRLILTKYNNHYKHTYSPITSIRSANAVPSCMSCTRSLTHCLPCFFFNCAFTQHVYAWIWLYHKHNNKHYSENKNLDENK